MSIYRSGPAPSGTITFLFTDIEGSTKMWEQYPTAMKAALHRHDTILREAVETNQGYVFKTVGDAFCAAFPTPHDALLGALHSQKALRDEQWPDHMAPIAVRMALHTGVAEERDGDYFGQPVNRVARLLSAGHGGQILISDVTQGLVRDSLPFSITLLDLGEHRLRDLTRPEHIFEVAREGPTSRFPPLKTLNNRPNNLPMQHTELVGREKEVAEVVERLGQNKVSLLTLTGPGGTGKTRLALQAAVEMLDDFQNGIFFVNLAPIADYHLFASTIAQVLDVKEAGGQQLLDTLKEFLREKRILLLLDNFEQIIEAAPYVNMLLAAAPGLKVVATSRVPLHLRGEKEYPVPPLQIPDFRHMPSLSRLSQYEAVRLFIERATDVKADFEVTNENAPAVAEICARLDGLPLAIELAAARVKVLPPQAMLVRLQSRLKVLTGGAVDLPARQQTLRNAIEWSYDLLSKEEKQLFRRLAAFQGGRTLEDVEAVCVTGDSADVLDNLQSLVDKSLLVQREQAGGEARFSMLETIHEYATEKLEESGEESTFRRRHAEYFVTLAEEAEPELERAQQARWLERLEAEHDNFRTAFRWAAAAGDTDLGMRLAGALAYFWQIHGHFTEGSQRLLELLASTAGQRTPTRAKTCYAVGLLVRVHMNDAGTARTYLLQSLELFYEFGDNKSAARALTELGDMELLVVSDLELCHSYFKESLKLGTQVRDHHNVAHVLNDLGELARFQGYYSQARTFYEQSLAISRETGDLWYIGCASGNLSAVETRDGNYERAEMLATEAAKVFIQLGEKRLTAGTVGIGLAGVALGNGHTERAVRLLGAMAALNEALGYRLEPADQLEFEHINATAKSALNEDAYAAAWEEGKAMSMDEAIRYAVDQPSNK